MERIQIRELNMNSREETLIFLKGLWNGEETACPICGTILEVLHKKAKKNSTDWQCRKCGKIFRTIHLLDELNREL